MIVDEDGRRVGRFETDDPGRRAGDTFTLGGQRWRIVQVLPEVSTMVAYDAVWIAAPAAAEEEDDAVVHGRPDRNANGEPAARS
jgi:hypothetical protein